MLHDVILINRGKRSDDIGPVAEREQSYMRHISGQEIPRPEYIGLAARFTSYYWSSTVFGFTSTVPFKDTKATTRPSVFRGRVLGVLNRPCLNRITL